LKPILFALFEPSEISRKLIEQLDVEVGDVVFHHFPDQESGVKINSDVKNRDIIVLMSLNQPDDKILPLLFFAKTATDLGAKKIGLIAPYLSYLRQDKRFNPGESITSRYFSDLLSQSFDWLVTIDPHLHRYKSLNEIYSIPTLVLHATDEIAKWIQLYVEKPIIIGPDMESRQWVSEIAEKVNAPYLILEKIRRGDKQVEVSIPDIHSIKNHSPVLVDDIISTARTMVGAVMHLKSMGITTVHCIGVHAIFAEEAYRILVETGIAKIITCNTINHETNAIDVSHLIIDALLKHKDLKGLMKLQRK
jgi:ribose-phosphate pyrophosphokinase